MEKIQEDLRNQAIDRFWETIPPVWSRIRANIRTYVTENFDISVEQFQILRHIHAGLHSVSELADVKHISRPAISQSLDALVSKGLVTRKQSVEDRRYVELELTPSGTALLDEVFGRNRRWMYAEMGTLSHEEMAVIVEAMTIIKRTFIG